MKRLLAALLLLTSVAYAADAPKKYTVKATKEIVQVVQEDGVVVTLPRTEMAKVTVENKLLYVTLALIGNKDQGNPLTFVVMDEMCDKGAGKIGVLDPSANQLLGEVDFDFKIDSPAAFVAQYMCTMGKGKGKTTTTKAPTPGLI